jgi:ABC-type glucose/galactose transport system permease subunit
MVDQAVASDFIKSCITVHTFQKELAMTIHLGGVVSFYVNRIGLPPVVSLWDEIREILDGAVAEAKRRKPPDIAFSIRLAGGGVPVWLCLKIFAAVVFQCDSVFYVGDCVVKI